MMLPKIHPFIIIHGAVLGVLTTVCTKLLLTLLSTICLVSVFFSWLYSNCLSFVSLNVRGLRDNGKHKALFLFAKRFKTDFFFSRRLIQQLKMLISGDHSGEMKFGCHMGHNIQQVWTL